MISYEKKIKALIKYNEKNSAKSLFQLESPTYYLDHFSIVILQKNTLTLSCMMLKNGQTYFKNLAVYTPQDF